MTELRINENLIDKINPRNTLIVEDEIKYLLTTKEGEKIKSDIELLKEMGYDKKMINKVYVLFQPENIERAIEYMTEINGIYQHNFFENHNSNKNKDLCFICNKNRILHYDYIPEDLLVDNNNNNNNQNNDLDNNNGENDSFNFSVEEDNNNIVKKENKNIISNECNVCFDTIDENDLYSNSLPCGHIYCTQCWLNYFKTLITDAKVEHIKCVDHECTEIISEDFILKHIRDDKILMDKYKKFKKRADIINDTNKRQCPSPDCDSFLEKSETSKYVKCERGHEYCFDCLKPPHGKMKCDLIMEKEFLKWKKKHKRVKRCPKCKIYTEKNEGCNHMTCVNCKYQWCWLCEGKYSYDHYSSGSCLGHQFTKADSVEEANKVVCCISLNTFFPSFYKKVHGGLGFDYWWQSYICIFVFWIFGYFFFAGFSMFQYTDRHLNLEKIECPFFFFGILIALFLFVCFQIIFFCLITPFILIAIVFPRFVDNIASFFCIGDNEY